MKFNFRSVRNYQLPVKKRLPLTRQALFKGWSQRRIMSTYYSTLLLPPFKPNSGGFAYPKPGPDVAACIAPAGATIERPPSWGEGQALSIAPGTWHIAQDDLGDSYPNMEFENFYKIIGELGEDDTRVVFLRAFWSERGYPNMTVVLARKVRLAIVVGVVADEAVGATFVNHEGGTEISPDGLILQSPDSKFVRWFITRGAFDKKYLGVETNGLKDPTD